MKKYYVYFIDWKGRERCHCFEQDKKEAKHFAKLTSGRIIVDY